jgi:hypothetical protein
VAHPSSSPLDVPYHPQVDDGYCLPACVQMVLAYLGLPSTQEHLAREAVPCLRPGSGDRQLFHPRRNPSQRSLRGQRGGCG